MTSRHPARVGLVFELLGRYVTTRSLTALIGRLNHKLESHGPSHALDLFSNLPDLWNRIHFDGSRFDAPSRHIPVYLGAHHEKICIIDGRQAFLGGLDVEQKRYDTPEHDAVDAWHDVACLLEGPAVEEFGRHFRQRWNHELVWFQSFLARHPVPQGVPPLPVAGRLAPMERDADDRPSKKGTADVIPLRTISATRAGIFHRTARPEVCEIAEAYWQAVAEARSFIYIETQYFRDRRLARHIAACARDAPDLSVILVIPLVPEVITLEGKPNAASRHGQFLQAGALNELRSNLGPRLGLFTLVRNGPAKPTVREEAVLHDSDLVYVHAKTAVFDDRVAIVGSANLNGRSFWCDTETALAWHDPTAVSAYRQKLWQRLLQRAVTDWMPAEFVSRWTEAASRNIDLKPGRRQGFVVSYPMERATLHARWHPLVPNENV